MSRLYVDRISPYESASVTVDGLDTSNLTTKTTFNSYTSSNDAKVTSLINATGSYINDSQIEITGTPGSNLTYNFPLQADATSGNAFINMNVDSDAGDVFAHISIQDRGTSKNDVQLELNSYTGLDGSNPVFRLRAGGNSAGGQNNAILATLSDGTANFYKTSTWVSGTKFNIGGEFNIAASDPLPSGVLGDLAVSGSALYFHNGSSWGVIS